MLRIWTPGWYSWEVVELGKEPILRPLIASPKKSNGSLSRPLPSALVQDVNILFLCMCLPYVVHHPHQRPYQQYCLVLDWNIQTCKLNKLSLSYIQLPPAFCFSKASDQPSAKAIIVIMSRLPSGLSVGLGPCPTAHPKSVCDHLLSMLKPLSEPEDSGYLCSLPAHLTLHPNISNQ